MIEQKLVGSVPNLEKAECLSEDPEIFFPRDKNFVAIDAAKSICSRCVEIEKCLENVLSMTVQPIGIWAGLTEQERKASQNQRNRRVAS